MFTHPPYSEAADSFFLFLLSLIAIIVLLVGFTTLVVHVLRAVEALLEHESNNPRRHYTVAALVLLMSLAAVGLGAVLAAVLV